MNHSHLDAPGSDRQTEAVIARLRAHGLAGPLAALLDGLAPLAPLSAQALYVAQPLAGLISPNWRSSLGALAATLERPGGAAALRAALLDSATDSHGG